jgi:IS1 family transposase
MDIHRDTVLAILETVGPKAAGFLDAKVRNVPAQHIQADEIHTSVYSKQINTPKDDTERGEQYTFISVDRTSKLIINWVIGKRTTENATAFMADLKERVPHQFQFQLTTDNWAPYLPAVEATFGENVDYATESKIFAKPAYYLPQQLIRVIRKARVGEPDMTMASTAHAERTNLSVRTFGRRYTRSTLGYSKKLANLKHAFALFVWHFNFCRKHSAHGQTPAMAAGLTDRIWKIDEILQYAV